MKNKKLVLTILLAMIVLISTSCSPSVEEIQPAVDEYEANLEKIYSELENQYAKTPTKEQWDAFSKDWMPKLTGSTPELLSEKIPEELTGRVAQLDDVKSKLMYLWTEYNKKISGEKFKEELIKELKTSIEENLKEPKEPKTT